ncbi:MAG: hypothetical protein ABSF84_02785 [Acidimicrobiales bacterium]|jgi:hypothetical protein
MRASWGGLAIGIAGLAVLDGVVSRTQASANVGGWLTGVGSAVQRFLDPTVPLFGSKTTTASATSGSSTSVTTEAAVAGPAITPYT